MAVAVFVTTVLGAVLLLVLAVWPGVLEDVVFPFPLGCFSVPVLGVWFVLLIGLAVGDICQRPGPGVRRRRWGLRSAAVMFATLGLLWLHVPQRIAFAFCYSDLRELVEVAPTDAYQGDELNRHVGPYQIDRYGADERGGVFFRTHTGPDGIGPDEMSYGFAFRPNGQGTPFGNAYYRHRHLFGDWYAFAASNDW